MLCGLTQAQMRGFGGGFRGAASFGGVRPAVRVHAWSNAPTFPRHGAFFFGGFGPGFGFGNFGRFPAICTPFAGCFRPAVFGVPFSGTPFFGRHNPAFFGGTLGFGAGFPFWGGGGYGGYGGYGYGTPYEFDQAGYDTSEYLQAQAVDRQRTLDEMSYDQRRNLELQRQLAELQATQEDANARQRAAQPAPARPPKPETPPTPAVLVFRDGKQMQIENYVITRDRLFALGPERRQTIQLSELDLNATVKANQERGVNFTVPTMPAEK